MTFKQWFDSVNGKFIDFDKNKKFWCVDLMRDYISRCLGLNGWIIPANKNAKSIFLSFPENGTKEFKKVWNTKTNKPEKGDIFFYGNRWLFFDEGHVCMVSDSTVISFISVDQNWPTGTPAHYVNHSYTNALGWLHPIK